MLIILFFIQVIWASLSILMHNQVCDHLKFLIMRCFRLWGIVLSELPGIQKQYLGMKFVKVGIEIIRFGLERFSAFVDSLVPTVWASLDTWALKLGFHLDGHEQSRWQVGAWPRIINHWSASEIWKQNTHSSAQRSWRAFDLWPVAANCIVHEGAPMAWTGFSRLLVPKEGQTKGRPDSCSGGGRARQQSSYWIFLLGHADMSTAEEQMSPHCKKHPI